MDNRITDAKEIEKALTWLSKYWDRPAHPEYHRAGTVDEAVSLLQRYGGGAKLIAGGIDLVGLMKNRVVMPEALINIKGIPRLRHVTEEAEGLSIGALTLINDMERSAVIKSRYPALHQAARLIASPQVRNMGTVGGNLCQDVRCWYYRRSPDTGISYNCRRKSAGGACYALDGENQYHGVIHAAQCPAVCASDMATVLSALDAGVNTVDTAGGRVIPVAEIYTALGQALEADEMITSVQVPHIGPGVKQRFLKFRTRKAIDFAIVSVAAVVTVTDEVVSDARIVLGGVSCAPYRAVEAEKALIGEPLTESAAVRAAEASVSEARPLSKNGYKLPIARTLVKRALLE